MNAAAVHRVFEGSVRLDALPLDDRGLAYGDGVFETMRASAGRLPWWEWHWLRLADGAARLGIDLPERLRVEAEIAELLAGDDALVKLILTRGRGERGYAPTPGAPFRWMLSRYPSPALQASARLRWCSTRLSVQPRLAGIKHCNRLEQVLARQEWATPDPVDAQADEGLMLDGDGHVVSAIAGNVFAMVDGQWLTPQLDRCGVRGICRRWALEALAAREVRLFPVDIEKGESVFVCNAVRGILEVTALGKRRWSPHPQVAALRARLAAEHPAFIPVTETP